MINSAIEKKYIKFVGPCDLLKMKTLLRIPPGLSDFHFLRFSKMDLKNCVAEPELELESEPEPEPFLAISAPAPRLWSRHFLFNKYFTLMSSVWRMPR